MEEKKYKLNFEGFDKVLEVKEIRESNTDSLPISLSIWELNDQNEPQYITTYGDFLFIKMDRANTKMVLEKRRDLGTIIARLHLGFVREYYEVFLKTPGTKVVQGHGKYQEDAIEIDGDGNIVNNEYVDYIYTVKALGEEDEVIQEVTFKSRFRIQDTEIEVDIIK